MRPDELRLLMDLVHSGKMSKDALARVLSSETEETSIKRRVTFDERVGDHPWGTAEEPQNLPVSNRYELEELIAEGGNGAVYLARDALLEREVALKIHAPSKQTSTASFARFVFEPRVTGALAHPGIIPVYDIGRLTDGNLFFSMQRVSGQNLAEVLGRLRGGDPETERTFTLHRLMRIFSQICQTVAYAHDHGVLHRDLKPENIMLGTYGEVYVADWGLAKSLEGDAGRISSRDGKTTEDGTLLGTVQYMSPEQVEGNIDEMGPASDVFSLGVMLYELLTLQLPFEGPSAVAVMFRIAKGDAVDPRQIAPQRKVPDALAELAMEALQVDPEQRCPSAAIMAERLHAFLDGAAEQERRAKWAAELLAKAQALFAEFEVSRREVDQDREVLRNMSDLPLDAPPHERQAQWKAREDLAEKRTGAERLLSRAAQTAEQAHELVPCDEVRELLEEIYWEAAQGAERAKDASALHFRDLARHFATGRHSERYATTGVLEITWSGPGEVRLHRQASLGPLLVDEPVDFSGRGELPVGSYVIEAELEGRMPARIPVLVEGARERVVVVEPPLRFDGHEEFVAIAGGEAVLGGDDKAPLYNQAQRRRFEPFLIGRYPITLEQYCEFLDDLAIRDVEAALARALRDSHGNRWLPFDQATGTFTIPTKDQDGDVWDPRWPAHMISWEDASAYCAWRSARDGVTIRLPTEWEWEYAARGVDQRIYPWGNGFDPTLTRMLENVRGAPVPVAVGSFPYDRSPWGVQDMAGIVGECTSSITPAGLAVSRGGSTRAPSAWCRVCARHEDRLNWASVVIGFRVARDL